MIPGDPGASESLLAQRAARREQELRRAAVVARRDEVQELLGAARRYRWSLVPCVVGLVGGGLGVLYCVVAAALSAWVDFGPTAVFATLFLSAVVLVCSTTALVMAIDDARIERNGVKRTPPDLLGAAWRAFDEAYAAYLDTAPVNTADAYLRPQLGGRSRR